MTLVYVYLVVLLFFGPSDFLLFHKAEKGLNIFLIKISFFKENYPSSIKSF